MLINLHCRAAFSSPWGSKEKAESEWNKEYDEPIFTSEPRNGGKYEKRTYSPSTWACTNLTVDTAAGTSHDHFHDDHGGCDHATPLKLDRDTNPQTREFHAAPFFRPSCWAGECAFHPIDAVKKVTFVVILSATKFWKYFASVTILVLRYKKKVPSSRMFWPLFRYIGGVNAGQHQYYVPSDFVKTCVYPSLL